MDCRAAEAGLCGTNTPLDISASLRLCGKVTFCYWCGELPMSLQKSNGTGHSGWLFLSKASHNSA